MMRTLFHVPDMVCPSCVPRLEGLQNELPGVTHINANYKKQTLEVEFDETRTSLAEIIIAADRLGFEVEPGMCSGQAASRPTVALPVTGMSCTNCARNIERNVLKLPGGDLRIGGSGGRERLVAAFDPAQMDALRIITRVKELGFGVPTEEITLSVAGLRKQPANANLLALLAVQEGVLAVEVGKRDEGLTLTCVPGGVCAWPISNG